MFIACCCLFALFVFGCLLVCLSVCFVSLLVFCVRSIRRSSEAHCLMFAFVCLFVCLFACFACVFVCLVASVSSLGRPHFLFVAYSSRSTSPFCSPCPLLVVLACVCACVLLCFVVFLCVPACLFVRSFVVHCLFVCLFVHFSRPGPPPGPPGPPAPRVPLQRGASLVCLVGWLVLVCWIGGLVGLVGCLVVFLLVCLFVCLLVWCPARGLVGLDWFVGWVCFVRLVLCLFLSLLRCFFVSPFVVI